MKYIVIAVFALLATLAICQSNPQARGCYCERGHWETQSCYYDASGYERCPEPVWVCDDVKCPQ